MSKDVLIAMDVTLLRYYLYVQGGCHSKAALLVGDTASKLVCTAYQLGILKQ